MADEQAREKWNTIYQDADAGKGSVSQVLVENVHLLPGKGKALDLACGKGRDAVFLASRGLDVDAWDISDEVINKLNIYADTKNLRIRGEARDIVASPPASNSYDIIVVAHFLDRTICPALIDALNPFGLLFYQTFSRQVTADYSGPQNPDFRLQDGEMLVLFQALKPVVYREELLIGSVDSGFRNEVLFVGQKR